MGLWQLAAFVWKHPLNANGRFSALARVEQAAEDITGWEPLAVGEIPSDGTSFVDLPVGPLRNAATRSYRMTESGLIAADVSRIVYRWASYPDRVHGLVFIGPDESFPENDANRLITHYTDVALELTPSPFLF